LLRALVALSPRTGLAGGPVRARDRDRHRGGRGRARRLRLLPRRLLGELGAEGNLLTVTAGQDVTGAPAPLPASALGGLGGVLLGAAATVGYAVSTGQAVVVPPAAAGGGLAVAVAVGVAAGVYPAVRAARLPPADALRSMT